MILRSAASKSLVDKFGQLRYSSQSVVKNCFVAYDTKMKNKLATVTKPTREAYSELQEAYDFFNKSLFNGRLPFCLITLQRQSRSYGYYSPKRFAHTSMKKQKTDEIAINPEHINAKDVSKVLSTLVHEMVHLEQQHFGTPSRAGYHNTEFAAMMERVGLVTSDTGKLGGKRTGQNMSHYIKAEGPFDQACCKLLAKGFQISWGDDISKNEKIAPDGDKSRGKLKYFCPSCAINAWGKAELHLVCGECDEVLEVAP